MPCIPTPYPYLGKSSETCPRMMILESWPKASPHLAMRRENTLKKVRKLIMKEHRTFKHNKDIKEKEETTKLLSLK